MVKNPNWQEADQLAIYKRSEELDSGQPRTSPASGRTGLEPVTSGFQIKRDILKIKFFLSVCHGNVLCM